MSELDDELEALPPSVRFAVLDAMNGRTPAITGRRSGPRPVATEAPSANDKQSKRLTVVSILLLFIVISTAIVAACTLFLCDWIVKSIAGRRGFSYDKLRSLYSFRKGLND